MKFRLRGINFSVGYEVVAALTLVLLLDGSGRIAACILAALLHESGHLIMMRLCSCSVQEVRVRLFDVLILADRAEDTRCDILITSGGVLMNLLCAGVFSFFSPTLMSANLVIGCFNLLPVETLDGGRLMMLLLSSRLSYDAAIRVVRAFSFLFLFPFFLLGIYVLLRTGYNYSLLAISLYLLAVLLIR